MAERFPDIMIYVSPVEYLNAIYQFQKRQNAGFSFESWSVELGYSSRSFLKMLCSGRRRITPEFIDNFSAKMSLTSLEKEYFETLVGYSEANSSGDKTVYLDRIFEIRGRAKRLACIDDEKFVLDPRLPLLQTLLTFKDVAKTLEGLGHLMNISAQDVEDLLTKLVELGLVKLNSDGCSWESLKSSFRVPGKQGSAVLTSFHNYSAMESIRAQELPADSRNFRSILIPLDPKSYKEFRQELEAVIGRFLAKYDREELDGACLYKVNFNAYPITQRQQSALKVENENGLVLDLS